MKEVKGKDFYDQAEFFERYMKHRGKPDNPNEVIETPIIRALIGDPNGKVCLDLGCGYGEMGDYLLDAGAHCYLGIDPSERMIEAAKKRINAEGMVFEIASVESFEWTMNAYDLVVARLVFHYVEDVGVIINKLHRSEKISTKTYLCPSFHQLEYQ